MLPEGFGGALNFAPTPNPRSEKRLRIIVPSERRDDGERQQQPLEIETVPGELLQCSERT